MSKSDRKEENLTVYYDGNCPICTREISYLKKRDPNCVIFQDFKDQNFDSQQIGLTKDQLDARIHARTASGEIIEGMEVFRRLYARAGLAWLLAPTGWKIFKPFFDGCYRIFARNRHKISKFVGFFLRN